MESTCFLNHKIYIDYLKLFPNLLNFSLGTKLFSVFHMIILKYLYNVLFSFSSLFTYVFSYFNTFLIFKIIYFTYFLFNVFSILSLFVYVCCLAFSFIYFHSSVYFIVVFYLWTNRIKILSFCYLLHCLLQYFFFFAISCIHHWKFYFPSHFIWHLWHI